ncbi:initiation-control protein yabA [Staphylococcus aureus]|nr:initiation-control protein yabA [Staphylococcus aureus]
MDRNEIFEKIMRLEMNVNQLSKETSELKALAVELVEENVALQLENDNLKKVLAMMNQLLLILRIQNQQKL